MKAAHKLIAQNLAVAVLCFGLGMLMYEGWQQLNKGPTKTVTDTSAHYEGVQQKVVMYSTQWCPYCQQARRFFAEQNIEVLERDIEQDDVLINRLYSSIEQKGVPQIVIGHLIVHGFDEQVLRASLEQQGLL